jgi:hypothetical protein
MKAEEAIMKEPDELELALVRYLQGIYLRALARSVPPREPVADDLELLAGLARMVRVGLTEEQRAFFRGIIDEHRGRQTQVSAEVSP